jgi:hypothetical protein
MRNLALALRPSAKLLPLLLFISLLAAAPAAQGFGIQNDDNGFRGSVFSSESEDETHAFSVDGTGIYDLAGGHPYKGITDFILTGTTEDNVDNLRVDIPPGLVPNPNRFDKCSEVALTGTACPVGAQIGTENLTISLDGTLVNLVLPLYNVEPRPGDVARFGFNPADAAQVPGIGLLASALGALNPVYIVGGVRDSAAEANPPGSAPYLFAADYGLFFTISDIPEAQAVIRSKLTFWGMPGDDAHDGQRHQSCAAVPSLPIPLDLCGATVQPGAPSDQIPFLTNPTRCTGAKLTARLIVNSHDGQTANRIDQTPTLPNEQGVPSDGAQHCEDVPFAPSPLALASDVTLPDTPSGPGVSLRIPQPGLADRDILATSHVKDASVTLPPGMTLNPSVANGLVACTDGQLAANAGIPGGDACPAGSDIGDTSVTSSLLPDDLTGNAYVGQPVAGDKYRLFVTLEGREVSVRLKGSVKPDQGTGQLTATFPNNPELPFEDLTVDFRGGARAPLATPLECGPKLASALLSPWSGTAPKTVSSNTLNIAGNGCPAGFSPTFGVASANGQAGALAPLTVSLDRPDRNQFLSRVRIATPPGLAGMISKVDQCADAQAATGSCPAASRIGTATTTAGAGSEPFGLSGPVYLTEGYKGGQFGMVVVIRAIAGPYDLGTVVVRQSIFVDPEDAHLTVVSDPFPTILDGVPIRLRNVDVALDKPGFVYNPTSCGPKPVGATIYPVTGTAVDRAASLSFTGCERLGFTPAMSMQFVGPRQTRFEGHPELRTKVLAPRGQANIGKVRVVLPKAIALDPKNSQKVCTIAGAAKADCPETTRIGYAKAISPALNEPLAGPVYFVQGIRTDPTTGAQIRTLPSLLAKLRGEIAINLRGTTAVEGGRLVSTFDRVPDAPVSDFNLNLKGGKKGPLVVSARRGICDRKQVTNTLFTGQNAKTAAQNVNIRKPCRRPMIVLRRIKASTNRLVVRGTIRPKATKPLRVSLRCGKTRITRTAKRRKGKWSTTIVRKGACNTARKAKLKVSYPGGGDFRIAVRKRSIKLPAGS